MRVQDQLNITKIGIHTHKLLKVFLRLILSLLIKSNYPKRPNCHAIY